VWVESQHVDPATLPELKLSTTGGVQSEVIRSGKPPLGNDVCGQCSSSACRVLHE
jgi:hypothetical protein